MGARLELQITEKGYAAIEKIKAESRKMSRERYGNAIQTYTGAAFWPLDPQPHEIFIEDIARSLSMRCRYGGHVRKFYSVAEHSVIVSRLVGPPFALWGLLHDASEAYTSDIPRPLKLCLPDFKPMEAKIMAAVCQRFGLPVEEPAGVKEIDFRICADERDALAPPTIPWDDRPEPLGVKIRALSPAEAEAEFLARFHELQAAHEGER